MKKIIIAIVIMFSSTVFSQTNDSTIFKITVQSEVSVLSDLIIFQITISEENTDPEQAYRIHKIKEHELAKLISNLV